MLKPTALEPLMAAKRFCSACWRNPMENLIIYGAIPVFALTMLLEHYLTLSRPVRGYKTPDTFTSIAMGLGSLVLGLGTDILNTNLLSWVHSFAPMVWNESILTWLLTYVVVDFVFYWHHRMHHEVRIGWAGHVNHHSSQYYNLSTALRQGWTELVTQIPFYLPLAFLGIPVHMILGCLAINLLYQFWIHTELIRTLGPLEFVMNTPSHHRVHHGSNDRYIDRNYAGTFIVWDRLFGSFELESEPVVYGIKHNLTSYNPLIVAFHEWQEMLRDVRLSRSWKGRWACVFGSPGLDAVARDLPPASPSPQPS